MRPTTTTWLVGASLLLFAWLPPAAASPADGRLLEPVRTEMLAPGGSGWSLLAGDTIHFDAGDGRIVARDVDSGRTQWRHDMDGGFLRRVIARGDELVAIGRDIEVLDRRTGDVVWRYFLGCEEGGACVITPVHLDDERAVLARATTRGGVPDAVRLLELDGRGDPWPAWARVGPVGSVSVGDGVVTVLAADERTVAVLEGDTGALRWRAALPPYAVGPAKGLRHAWADRSFVHVVRAAPDGIASAVIDTYYADLGALLESRRSLRCNGSVSACGLAPVPGGVVVWGPARHDRPDLGRVVLHDLMAGETPLDAELYLAAPPLVIDGRLLVVAERKGARVEVRAHDVEDGTLRWTTTLPEAVRAGDRAHPIRLTRGGDDIVVVAPRARLVLGLSPEDGRVRAYGVAERATGPLQAVTVSDDGVTLRTRSSLTALRARPPAPLAGELRDALAERDDRRARLVDAVAVRLGDALPDADHTHALMIRHALLSVYRVMAIGGGATELGDVRALLEATPHGRLEPIVAFSRGVAPVLSDWLLDDPDRGAGGAALAIEAVSQALVGHLGALEEALVLASDDEREAVRVAGLQLVEVLARDGRPGAAVRLLAALDAAPIALFETDVPVAVRRTVAERAAANAREAAEAARRGRLGVAVDRLEDAVRVPFARAFVGLDDRQRRRILDLRYAGRPQPEDVAALAETVAAAWEGAIRPPKPGVDCVASCERRHATCERPCVTAAACEDARLSCEAGCRTSGSPTWAPPPSLVSPRERDYALRCLE